jgi:hypothetical protein
MHGEHERARAAASPRQLSARVFYVTTGDQLVALHAQTGLRVRASATKASST